MGVVPSAGPPGGPDAAAPAGEPGAGPEARGGRGPTRCKGEPVSTWRQAVGGAARGTRRGLAGELGPHVGESRAALEPRCERKRG